MQHRILTWGEMCLSLRANLARDGHSRSVVRTGRPPQSLGELFRVVGRAQLARSRSWWNGCAWTDQSRKHSSRALWKVLWCSPVLARKPQVRAIFCLFLFGLICALFLGDAAPAPEAGAESSDDETRLGDLLATGSGGNDSPPTDVVDSGNESMLEFAVRN